MNPADKFVQVIYKSFEYLQIIDGILSKFSILRNKKNMLDTIDNENI